MAGLRGHPQAVQEGSSRPAPTPDLQPRERGRRDRHHLRQGHAGHPRQGDELKQQIIDGRSSRRPRFQRTRLEGRPRAALASLRIRASGRRPPRPRDARHHQALPGRRRERRRRLRPAPAARCTRCSARTAQEVDADEHPLRALQARRGRDPREGQADEIARRATRSPGVGMVHQHFMLIPVMTVAENVVLAMEPRRRGPVDDGRRGAARAELAGASSSRSTRSADREHLGRPAAARRDPEGALPAPTS